MTKMALKMIVKNVLFSAQNVKTVLFVLLAKLNTRDSLITLREHAIALLVTLTINLIP
jgi:hypothetical protein